MPPVRIELKVWVLRVSGDQGPSLHLKTISLLCYVPEVCLGRCAGTLKCSLFWGRELASSEIRCDWSGGYIQEQHTTFAQ